MRSKSSHTPLCIWLMHQDRETGKLKFAGGRSRSAEMCDFSLQSVKSRPAKVGDKLTTRDFRMGTRGFAASEDASVAVCVLTGNGVVLCGRG